MPDPTITVVVPTIGRASLDAALDSCSAADEVIVIHNQDGDMGYKARTEGIAQATGTHLAFLDDDDVYTVDAIDLMREHACDRPVIFRMQTRDGYFWTTPTLRFGNIGSPMFLVPNAPKKLGVWEPYNTKLKQPGGDFKFLEGCVAKMGDPVWREETVAVVRPKVAVAA